MTANMQKVLIALGVVIVAALLWIGLVSPARDDADAAKAAQTQAETQAAAVAGQLTTAREAAKRTPANARTLRRLAVAVPEKVEAPALIDQLDSTAKRFDVSFDVLKVSNGAATAAPTAAAAAAQTTTAGTPAGVAADGSAVPGTPGTAAAPAGSVPVELNVELAGTYVNVTRFVKAVQADVRTSGGTNLHAKGRLLRITAIDLDGDGQGEGRRLKGTLTVTAYLLPKDSSATAAVATATTPGTTTAPTTTGSQP
ncbi:type II secretion system protein GspM [Patulibacter sp. NPDC049589]|uniref:type II secretion system protein GspM n=1 Tax=Patulibacter sp. NPDC049589 TaxID=3154731 RepID=UPI003449EF88